MSDASRWAIAASSARSAGFSCARSAARALACAASAPSFAAASCAASTCAPAGWRAASGFYALAYTHARQPAGAGACVELKCVAMGGQLLVHAMLLAAAQQQLISWQLEPAKHVLGDGGGVRDSGGLRGLAQLMHGANAKLAQPQV